VEPGKPAWHEIVAWQGPGILRGDGSINRERLGRIVFNNAAERQKLNRIIHPRVAQEMAARTAQIRQSGSEAVLVYDVPLLIEAGLHRSVDLVVLVYARPEVQLQRLQQRDNLSREEALARIQAQMPLEEKKKHAHFIIDNSGSPEDTAIQVDRLWPKIILQGAE